VDYCPFDIVSSPEPLGLETRRVETRYGTVVARVSKECRSDTGTLYIHGVGADWTTWTPMIRAETACALDVHDQVFIDMPGFGDSENRLDELDIADVGETMLAVAGRLGYSRLRVVGHSMGGFLTLDMASRHPERIESVHLIAGPYFSILTSIQHPLSSFGHDATVAATFGVQYALARAGRVEVRLARLSYDLGLFRVFLFPFVSHPFRMKESVVRSLSEQINPRGLLLTAANGNGYTADEQWARISCPIWAVFGEKDKLVPARDMRRFAICQPGAVSSVVRDAGHLMHVERPVDVVRALHLWERVGQRDSR
jgi:pimeloyl-ACP methyl ester carboxylesterase